MESVFSSALDSIEASVASRCLRGCYASTCAFDEGTFASSAPTHLPLSIPMKQVNFLTFYLGALMRWLTEIPL